MFARYQLGFRELWIESLSVLHALPQKFYCEFCEISKNTFFTEHRWTTASVLICLVFAVKGITIFIKREFRKLLQLGGDINIEVKHFL